MSMQPDFRTPLKRAIGLGSAKDGTGHFLWQRITAIALGLCGIYLIGLLLGPTGAEYVFAAPPCATRSMPACWWPS